MLASGESRQLRDYILRAVVYFRNIAPRYHALSGDMLLERDVWRLPPHARTSRVTSRTSSNSWKLGSVEPRRPYAGVMGRGAPNLWNPGSGYPSPISAPGER